MKIYPYLCSKKLNDKLKHYNYEIFLWNFERKLS